jgi:hypothetical protein
MTDSEEERPSRLTPTNDAFAWADWYRSAAYAASRFLTPGHPDWYRNWYRSILVQENSRKRAEGNAT